MLYYVSSKLKHREKWLTSGLKIVSSWIHKPEKISDVDKIHVMWNSYAREIDEAEAFVLYLEAGEVPKGALIELGMAFTNKYKTIYIVWSGSMKALEDIVGTVVWHRQVRIIDSLDKLPR